MKTPCVYILASCPYGTLYIGVTSNLPQRMQQHREGVVGSFTARYRIHQLVYYEAHETMDTAIRREKQLKKWRRAWKLELIHQRNSEWSDLSGEISA
jgi:putative endonuclease